MSEQPSGSASTPDRKQTAISDLPQADENDGDDSVRGGALVIPCVRTRPLEPCLKPVAFIPCIRSRG